MGLEDLPVLADDVGDPAGVLVAGTVARSIREADLVVRVGNEPERKVELVGEALAVLTVIEADADDLGVLRFVLIDEVPEPGTLLRSARCIGLGKKPENDFLSPQVAEADRVSAVVGRIEFGSFVAGG